MTARDISPNVRVIIQQNHCIIFYPFPFAVGYGTCSIYTSEPYDSRYTPMYHTIGCRTLGISTHTLRRIFNPIGGNDHYQEDFWITVTLTELESTDIMVLSNIVSVSFPNCTYHTL